MINLSLRDLMSMRNILLKIIKGGLLLGFLSVGSPLLARDIKTCPENFQDRQQILSMDGKKGWKLKITKSRTLKDALNNPSLGETIGVLKIDLLEAFQEFVGIDVSTLKTKYGETKYTKKFDTRWNSMKRAIASMRDLGTCIKNDRIYRSGEWSSKSFDRANMIFEADEVWAELSNLESEDPNFDLDKLVNKYPNFFEEDPEIQKKILDNWRKNRYF